MDTQQLYDRFALGRVIPAQPLALDANRQFDEQRQRMLNRYYLSAGAGGLAVAVHTTQFEVRDQPGRLFERVLEIAMEEKASAGASADIIMISGVIGDPDQAVHEAELAASLGYDAVLVSNAGLADLSEDQLVERHARIGDVIPTVGFYLQPAVGGRVLSPDFWTGIADLESTVAIKSAPFNRYRNLDLVQGVAKSSRWNRVALYTGNDDNIVDDLLAQYRVPGPEGDLVDLEFLGGLLGHWSVWTKHAVELLDLTRRAKRGDADALAQANAMSASVTLSNKAVFDVDHNFAGVIAGVHEVLRQQGLLEGIWCLDPEETLSPGQQDLITQVIADYPWLAAEQEFIDANKAAWAAGPVESAGAAEPAEPVEPAEV